jgi:integrase
VPPPAPDRDFGLAKGLAALRTEIPDDCTVAEFVEAWAEYLRARKDERLLKPETANEYTRIAHNVIAPSLGDREVRSLEAADAWCLAAQRIEGTAPVRRPSKTWQQVSRDRALRELAALRVMLGEACRHGLIQSNPCLGVEAQVRAFYTQKGRPRVSLTRHDCDRLISKAPAAHRTLLLLLSRIGCRLGEALALRIESLDPDTGMLTIDSSWTHAREVAPKSEAGKRDLRLPPSLVAEMLEQCRRVDVPVNRLRLMFPGPRGGFMDPGHWRETVFDPAVEATGLDPNTVPHTLRHSAAVTMLRGVPETGQEPMLLKHVQAVLGHAVQASTEVYTKTKTGDFAGPFDVLE